MFVYLGSVRSKRQEINSINSLINYHIVFFFFFFFFTIFSRLL